MKRLLALSASLLVGCTLGVVPGPADRVLRMEEEAITSKGFVCQNRGEILTCDEAAPSRLPLIISNAEHSVGFATVVDALATFGKSCAELSLADGLKGGGSEPPNVSCAKGQAKELVMFAIFVDLPDDGVSADAFSAKASTFLAEVRAFIDRVKSRRSSSGVAPNE